MVKRSSTLTYRDPRYGFTLNFPEYWRRYSTISRKNDIRDADSTLRFIFKYQGRTYDSIFSIFVFRMSRQEWLEQGYGDSPLVFMAEHGGRVFAYETAEELPSAFLNKNAGDYDYVKYRRQIQLLKTMVNRDVPTIVKTFRFPGISAAPSSAPHLSRKVCRRRRSR